MPALEPYRFFIEPLERLGLPYCVTGSVAAGVYGETRYTADVDFVLLLRREHLGRLHAIFPEADYYLPPDETLIFEVLRDQRGVFNIIHQGSMTKADIFVAGGDPLHAWALRNRRRGELPGGAVWVAPPEYVILRKLEFLREGQQEKHVRDVQFMLLCTQVDRGFIGEHVARLGLGPQWERCQPPPTPGLPPL